MLITLTTAGSYAGSYGYRHYSHHAAHESALKTQAAASTKVPEHPAVATAPTSLPATQTTQATQANQTNQTNQTNQPDQTLQAAQTLQMAPASSSAQNAPVPARNLAAIETDKQPAPTTSSQWMRDHRPTPIKLAVSTHSPDSADANLTSTVTAPTVAPAATLVDQTISPASSANTPSDTIQNPLTVEQHYTRFTQALSRNELTIAQTHLNTLATLLPQESISLLRARAWYFSQAQDTSSARTTYEAILKRLPGD
ncbi:MAG: hypothetical protein KUL75_01785, partial [Sterolibacterium sp.]|nr:hypothetical protein [Sterolibacterium sp.]